MASLFDLTLTVTYFGILLGFGILIANVLKKRKIPDTFFLLLLGLVLGPTLAFNPIISQYININLVDVGAMGNIPDFLRILALILIVFSGTFKLSFSLFKRVSGLSIKLAVIGVVFSTIFLGFVAHLIFGIELVFAMLLGAVISGTGSGVIFAFEDVLPKSRKALSVLKIESVFNSPLTVLLPLIFLDVVALEPGALFTPLVYLSQFWEMIAAGAGTGLLIGVFVAIMLKRMQREYGALLLFAVALITYALAENIGGSGILAVAVCGLVAGKMLVKHKEEIGGFDDQISEMLRISVFTLFGAQVTLLFGLHELFLILVFFTISIFLRPIFLMLTLGGVRHNFSRSDLALMSFVAPKGIAAAAMAPIIAASVIALGSSIVGIELLAERMVNIIFVVIMLSILLSSILAKIISHRQLKNGCKGKKIERMIEKKVKKIKPLEQKKELLMAVAENKIEKTKNESTQQILEKLEEKEEDRGNKKKKK
ncbi:MAG: cation:proton antiporter [Nanoarchaeota archaeon]|nr:cation:proton antiporter [Nanoarchaeota archaeon]MBU1135712.1 cation:proton antiporter [Nanoarchaeota archaeon]MBU2520496.1 cation:proton antiporter [Nanoarchaeota archaeon]